MGLKSLTESSDQLIFHFKCTHKENGDVFYGQILCSSGDEFLDLVLLINVHWDLKDVDKLEYFEEFDKNNTHSNPFIILRDPDRTNKNKTTIVIQHVQSRKNNYKEYWSNRRDILQFLEQSSSSYR